MTTTTHARRGLFRGAFASIALSATLVQAGLAQGTRADYARADGLRARTSGKVFKARIEPHWFDRDERFWYRNNLPDGAREFLVVDAARGTRRPAFDHEALALALTRALGTPQKATHLPIERIAFAAGILRVEADGKTWLYDDESRTLAPILAMPEAPTVPRREGRRAAPEPPGGKSRDGAWVAFVMDRKLYLRDDESGEEFALSPDADEGDGYEPNVFWSPDSTRFAAVRTRKGDDRKVYLIESSPRDQLQPKIQTYDYLKPGDRMPISRPHLFDVATRREIPVADALFANPWSVQDFRWSSDSARFSFLYNERGHQVLRLVSVDAATGTASALIEERSATFIDYSQKSFWRRLHDTDEILWMSERDGWNHLYLFDGRTGRLKNQVTRGEWVVRGVERVDEERRQIWFRAGGIRPGQDPYYIHHARVNFDGTGLVILTEGDGTHEVAYSPDRKYLIDTYSRVDQAPISELRSAEDGRRICELERADDSALRAAGWAAPERFAAKGRDGATDIFGVIYRPSNFDPGKTYPVIESIYAGPQGAFVPKAFAASHPGQSMAELGFIVVQIDGMGTNWRSKAFHDVCWKNLGDAGFPDRILWMQAAAAKYPALDLSRVGVYGGSAGGQNAMGALLFHGDFYKAAVADCGCHDNRMDKIWWNEAWMGWPVGPHYAEQSNVTQAHRLRGKLLLMVGELDRNVDPASTMQVVNALIRAGKDFELVVFPGAGHGAGSGRYGERRRRDFFVRHLLGVQPPDRNEEPTGDSPDPLAAH